VFTNCYFGGDGRGGGTGGKLQEIFTEYLKRAGKLPLEGMKADGALYCIETGVVWRRRKRVQVFGGEHRRK